MNTKQPFVITISRELGSGGRTIGQKLAAQLGVRFSDKNLIKALMLRFNLTTYEIERIKAKDSNWFTDFLEMAAPMPGTSSFVGFEAAGGNDWNRRISQKEIFEAEAEILKGIAHEGSCVITGRSGFHVLKDHPNKLNIFIIAPLEKRIERVMQKQGVSREEAATIIKSVDEGRERFVKRFAGVSRYDARNYDLVLNVAELTDDEAVHLILKFIKCTD